MGLIDSISKQVSTIANVVRRPTRKKSILDVAPWIYTAGQLNKAAPLSWNVYYDAMNHEWINACIGAIVVEILAANFEVGLDKEDEQPNEANVEYLTDLFQYPGGHDDPNNETYTSFMWKAWTSYLGTGDLFCEVAPNDVNKQLPAGLYYIPPHVMSYDYDRSAWFYTGSSDVFEPNELIHIKQPDPRDAIWGLSNIDSLARGLTLDLHAMKFNRDFFKSGMHPRSIASYDPKEIGETEYENEIDRFKTESAKNPRGIMFMYGGKFQDIGQTNKELEFSTMLNMVRDRILGVYGVPPQKVGIFESANLGSGRDVEADKSFWKKRQGEIRLFEDGFNNILGKELDWPEKWRIGTVDLEDKLLRAQIEDLQVKTYIKPVNEIRAGYNLDPVDWGDTPFIPQNYLPPVGNAAASGAKRFLQMKGLVKEGAKV